jgi:cytochrome c553
MPRLVPSPLIAAVGIGAVAIATTLPAQDRQDDPDIEELQERVTDERVLFGVQVDGEVTDDLLKKGRLVAMGGAEAGGADMACISCHGAQGQGDGSGAFPRIAGQAGWYLYKQLMDYASEARSNEVMTDVARNLTEHEMEAVSVYYAAIDAPLIAPLGDVDAETLQWGGKLAAVGSSERGIPACANCHGPAGAGVPPTVPYLAGQHSSYTEYQLQLWADGVRDNDAMNVMSAVAEKMTEDDMKAVSAYFARVHREDAEAAEDAEVADSNEDD